MVRMGMGPINRGIDGKRRGEIVDDTNGGGVGRARLKVGRKLDFVRERPAVTEQQLRFFVGVDAAGDKVIGVGIITVFQDRLWIAAAGGPVDKAGGKQV